MSKEHQLATKLSDKLSSLRGGERVITPVEERMIEFYSQRIGPETGSVVRNMFLYHVPVVEVIESCLSDQRTEQRESFSDQRSLLSLSLRAYAGFMLEEDCGVPLEGEKSRYPLSFGTEMEIKPDLDNKKAVDDLLFFYRNNSLGIPGSRVGDSVESMRDVFDVCDFSSFYPQYVSAIQRFFSGRVPAIEDVLSIARLPLISPLDRLKDLSFRGIIPADIFTESDDYEIASSPVQNVDELLEEFDLMNRLGALETQDGFWNMQITVAGIELGPQKTDIMDISLMLAAAGYLPDDLLERFARLDIGSLGYSEFVDHCLVENYPKASLVNDNLLYYYPFHKVRDNLFYRRKSFKGQNIYTPMVEQRGLFNFASYERSDDMRFCLKFIEKCAELIYPYQQGLNGGDCWRDIQKSWIEFLSLYNYPELGAEDYYCICNSLHPIREVGRSMYESRLTELYLDSASNPEFRAKAREICNSIMEV